MFPLIMAAGETRRLGGSKTSNVQCFFQWIIGHEDPESVRGPLGSAGEDLGSDEDGLERSFGFIKRERTEVIG